MTRTAYPLATLALVAVVGVSMASPVPPGAMTDCGPSGTLRPLDHAVPFTPGNVATARQRYGPCFGASSATCDDNAVNALGDRRCITTEAERAVIIEALLWRAGGSCTPPLGTPWPSEQDIEDVGVAWGAYRALHREWWSACTVAPTPTPQPSPSPTPAATPQPTAAPTASPCECWCDPPPAVVREALQAVPERGVRRITWQLRAKVDAALAALAMYRPCGCSTGSLCNDLDEGTVTP